MAYTKQNFKAGDVLYASQLNAMDNELKAVSDAVADLSYTQIAISSFTASPAKAEIGSTVSSVSLIYTLNKTPKTLTVAGSAVSNPAASGSVTKTGSFTSDQSWTLATTDERDASDTKTASLTFLNRVYYGTAEEDAIDSAFLLALSGSTLSGSKARTITVSAGEDEYIWYAVPARLGTCAFKVGGFDGGFILAATINHTNASGYVESYLVYRSDNVGLGSTTVEVS